MRNHGVDSPLKSQKIKDKIKVTNLKIYGVEHVLQSNEIKLKSKNTCQQKYGVNYPMQCKEIQEKIQENAKRFKSYTFPSGKVIKVQGYEPYALNNLINMKYTEDQLVTQRRLIPRIQYILNDVSHYHFPDIFIPHENKLIEVKSLWTIKCKEDNIVSKRDAAIEAGYRYEIWCYDCKGNRIAV